MWNRGYQGSYWAVWLLLFEGLVLSACAVHAPPNEGYNYQPRMATHHLSHRAAYNRTYKVDGRWYHVLPSCAGYAQKGIASWYGPDFNGHLTSTGSVYNMYGMTAASKVVPLPCWVRVTNLENGRQVIVKINDRGPFVPNRIIDLSYGAAKKLDMIGPGTAIVEVQAFDPHYPARNPPPPRSVSQGAPQPKLFLQVGAFAQKGNAQHLQQVINLLNLGHAVVHRWPTRGQLRFYTVLLGPLPNVNAVDQASARMRKVGLKGFQVNVQ